jgi:hypothetical protein
MLKRNCVQLKMGHKRPVLDLLGTRDIVPENGIVPLKSGQSRSKWDCWQPYMNETQATGAYNATYVPVNKLQLNMRLCEDTRVTSLAIYNNLCFNPSLTATLTQQF